MAKGPAPLNPEVVYNAIVRLGGARLDQIHVTLTPISRSSVSRAIRKLAGRCIEKTGEIWTPISEVSVLDPAPQVGQVEVTDSIPVLDPVAEVGQVDPQVGQVGQVEALLLDPVGQVGQVGQNHVVLHGSKNMATGAPANNGEPDDSFARMGKQTPADADRPDGGSVQQKDTDETVADAAFRAARATASLNGEPSQVDVMKFFLTYVATVKSRHNQQEGLKKSRDKDYQIKGYTQKEKIDAMRDLAIHLMGAVAQNTLIRDLRWISDSMDLLIADWSTQKSMQWARNKMRVSREDEDEDAWKAAAEDQDPTSCGSYGDAPIPEATKETPLVADEDDEMEPMLDAVHSNVSSDTELTCFNGGPAPEAPVHPSVERDRDQAFEVALAKLEAEMRASEEVQEPAAATEPSVAPPSAQECVAAQEADQDLQKLDAQIIECMARGTSGYVPIAAAIGSDRDTVQCRQNAMLANGRLVNRRDADGCMVMCLPAAPAPVPAPKAIQKSRRLPGES